MKERLYAVAVLLLGLLMLGTAGAMELGNITFAEGTWQIGVSVVAGLWFCNLIRIEETRAARKRR